MQSREKFLVQTLGLLALMVRASPLRSIPRCSLTTCCNAEVEAVRAVPRVVLDSTGDGLPCLRQGASGRVSILPVLRGAARWCCCARAAEDGDSPVLRRRRLDGHGRVG